MADLEGALADIRSRLNEGAYRNEGQVRLALVARILLALNWNIWDPNEVASDYVPPHEPGRVVDLALLAGTASPVLIEVNDPTEETVASPRRECGPGNEAGFQVFTNGRKWRFFCRAGEGGDAAVECFAHMDLLKGDLYGMAHAFRDLLGKWSVEQGEAELEAQNYAAQTRRRRILAECLAVLKADESESTEADHTDALVAAALAKEIDITPEEAGVFIEQRARREASRARKRAAEEEEAAAPPEKAVDSEEGPREVHVLNPDGRINLDFTSLDSGRLGETGVGRWGALLHAAIRLAGSRGMPLRELNRIMTIEVKQGGARDRLYKKIEGTDFLVPPVDATRCYTNAFIIANNLNLELDLHFRWHNRAEAEFPGEKGSIHWTPPEGHG